MLGCLTAEVLRQESRRHAGRKKVHRRAVHAESVPHVAGTQGTQAQAAPAGFCPFFSATPLVVSCSCGVMSYTLHKCAHQRSKSRVTLHLLHFTRTVKSLGMTIDNTLSFDNHINNNIDCLCASILEGLCTCTSHSYLLSIFTCLLNTLCEHGQSEQYMQQFWIYCYVYNKSFLQVFIAQNN